MDESALANLSGKNIVIFEDIIDTGRTMTKLLNTLSKVFLRPENNTGLHCIAEGNYKTTALFQTLFCFFF